MGRQEDWDFVTLSLVLGCVLPSQVFLKDHAATGSQS